MVSEFSTFGSCSSRNIFYSRLNENYKQYFHINHCVEFVNIVSLMSGPVEYDDKLINSISDYSNSCIKEDLNKGFLDFLKDDDVIEYLIIDTFYDVEVSNLIVNENASLLKLQGLRRQTSMIQLKTLTESAFRIILMNILNYVKALMRSFSIS